MIDLTPILDLAASRGASDVHLTVGSPPLLRLMGQIEPIRAPALSEEMVLQAIHGLLRPEHRDRYQQGHDVDTSFTTPSGLRLRVNAFRHTRGPGVALRLIPDKIPKVEELNLPKILPRLAMKRSGLILVTGPTGSGKTTTLAALIDHINHELKAHILTIEDPVEFLLQPNLALIHQREVGTHATSFADALRSALREDPDVIMVGEMRDLETMRLALQAAETGHLVLATLHTRSAPQTLDRIVAVFPGDEQPMVRQMLADSLTAVMCQALIPRCDQPGRVAAFELLVSTPAVQNLVREHKLHQLHSVIQTGTQLGMVSLDQSLRRLVAARQIEVNEARRVSLNPGLFKR